MSRLPLVVLPFAVLLSFAPAQEAPQPAPELQQLAPLLGNWKGSGTSATGPGEQTKWTARASYRWVLDGHFLREDTEVVFEGMPAPMVFRAFHGWDRERGRYVSAAVNNAGSARLHELHLMPDGAVVQIIRQHQQGMPYAERARSKVAGESMSLAIDLLLPEGPGMTAAEGTLVRTDAEFEVDWSSAAWQGAMPAVDLQRLARSAGTYAVTGAMTMAPGLPEIAITGTDTFGPVFGDTIFRGLTVGKAEGMPGEYRGEVYWSFDDVRDCLTAVYVSNMGEVMTMDAWWVGDGELVSTYSGKLQGQVIAQRMLMTFDDEGRAVEAVADTLTGTAPAYRSFRASYAKQ